MGIALGAARSMLLSGNANDYLAAAVPASQSGGSDVPDLPGDQAEALSLALSGFAIIGDLAAVAVTGPADDARRSALIEAARAFDHATGGSFGLGQAAGEILLNVAVMAAGHPLTGSVAEWIRTPTWQESEAYLSEHDELIGEEAEAALAGLVHASPDDTVLALHTNLLATVRRDGVSAAYNQLRAELAAERSAAVIGGWLACAPDWQASAAYHAQNAAELADPAAVAVLAGACGRNPGDAQLWLHLGLALLGDSRADGYQSAASGNPDPFHRARESLDHGALDAALAWSCLARASNRGQGALLMTRVQLALQQPDQAAEALADAASHITAHQLADVLDAYSDLLRAQPEEPWRHAEHASALERAERHQEALAAYDRAIALAPDNPSMHFNKGNLLFALGRLDEAAAELEDVVRLRPDDVLGARVLLGAIAWPVHQDQARDHFAAAISSPGAQLTPATRSKYRAVALAGLGRLADAEQELEAAQAARSASDETPDDADTRLLQLLQNPPLPGLDILRPLLKPEATSSTEP